MRIFLSAFIISLLTMATLQAQSVQINETSATRSNSFGEFPVAGHIVNISGNKLSFINGGIQSSSINEHTSISTLLSLSEVSIFEGSGMQLFSSSSFSPKSGDSSVKVYAQANGNYVVRENIANFLFFNSWGDIKQSISNSSQSTEGESVSELAADPAFKTIVIYNPTIVRNGVEGSRARIVNNNFTTTNLFSSNNREIRNINVSEDGQFIGILTYQNGSDDLFSMFDRFGNGLVSISFDQTIEDAVISSNGEFVTLRSNGRVGVYSTLSGERIGSTSFRSRLVYAEFIPEDQTILALTATQSGSVLNDVEVHAINIEQRSVERQEYNSALSTTNLLPLRIEREGSDRYILKGLNKTLKLQVQF
ncbi:hypothetical protein [Gracilimonas sp.]|uniref:hypothetical protein n=1 Tax=Gracilimonas sp. TaxID=1974203 RepID=UPI002871B837|nr:hypothetical protein [Gracilimonas sp.]